MSISIYSIIIFHTISQEMKSNVKFVLLHHNYCLGQFNCLLLPFVFQNPILIWYDLSGWIVQSGMMKLSFRKIGKAYWVFLKNYWNDELTKNGFLRLFIIIILQFKNYLLWLLQHLNVTMLIIIWFISGLFQDFEMNYILKYILLTYIELESEFQEITSLQAHVANRVSTILHSIIAS